MGVGYPVWPFPLGVLRILGITIGQSPCIYSVYKKFIINTKTNIKGSKALMINAYSLIHNLVTLYERARRLNIPLTQNGKALVSIKVNDPYAPVLEYVGVYTPLESTLEPPQA